MKLSAEQLAQYDRDGFLVFPDLIAADEVAVLKQELARVGDIPDERVVRERSGGPRIVYGMHEKNGPTASSAYAALVSSSRILQPVRDILGEDVYIFHTKANTKQALDGAIYVWHQDYANWHIMDGIPTTKIITAMVMLDPATELGGCLYFVPGSHRLGVIRPDVPESELDAAILRVVERGEPMAVPNRAMIDIVEKFGEPVPIAGQAGTVAFFDGNMVHGSGHNMSVHSRWILYIVYAAISNRPQAVPKPRAEYKASRLAGPVPLNDAASILESAA
jgi:ectoine hydroxylase